MADVCRILIADDEETFRCATADLLIREGYECDQATDAPTAAKMLGSGTYDLLIADIKMPGNPDLQLVRAAPQIAKGLPVILVTGYPELSTAIGSIGLPVAAYLIKPLDMPEFLTHVRRAVRYSTAYRSIGKMRQHLEVWCGEVEMGQAATEVSQSIPSITVDSFVSLTMNNIVQSLLDLQRLAMGPRSKDPGGEICRLMACPRLMAMKKCLQETVETLEKTKASFKSRELGELRRQVEQVLGAIGS